MTGPAKGTGSALREILIVEQTNPALRRRWFQSDYFDLFVWQEPGGAFSKFQLCYDVASRERALSWKQAAGFYHDGVDNPRWQSPLLVPGGTFDSGSVVPRFERESTGMPAELRDFILCKIREYLLERHRQRDGRKRVRREGWQERPVEGGTPPEN